MLYKVAVTGNICSGKSSAVKFLSSLPNTYVLYYDQIGHTVYERNLIFLNLIKKNFLDKNPKIFSHSQTIYENFDRKELGKIIFDKNDEDNSSLKTLNSLINPERKKLFSLKLKEIENQLKNSNSKAILFVEGAIIIESGSAKFFEEIWLTVASRAEIEKRFLERIHESSRNNTNTYNMNILDQIIKTQMKVEEKKKFCDHVIDTSGDFETTKKNYLNLYKKIINTKF
jgi:dephospho-CoA kinase